MRAIEQMPSPTDKEGIQRLIGTLNFLGPFLPNMPTVTQPLRTLLRKDAVWMWGPEHETALGAIKKILTDDPVLKYFDLEKKTELQVDASQHGLGAVLMQEGNSIAYTSRSLTPAEVKYPQINKELLRIVFGCERFNHCLWTPHHCSDRPRASCYHCEKVTPQGLSTSATVTCEVTALLY